MNKLIPITSYVVSGLVLIIYPFVFIAGIMSLAAFGGGEFGIDAIIALCFLLLSMLYPVTYFVSLIIYLVQKNFSQTSKLVVISAPYIHLCLAVLFFILWMLVS